MPQPASEVIKIKQKKAKLAQPATQKAKADIKVYKCPFKECSFQAFNYDDVTIHRINQHADTPKFMTSDLSGDTGFSKQRLSKQNKQMLMFKFNIIKMRVKIFMKDWEERQKKQSEKIAAKRKLREEAKEKKEAEVKADAVKV